MTGRPFPTPSDPRAALAPSSLALPVLIVSAAVLGLAPILVRFADTGAAAAGFWRFAFALPLLLVLTARP